MSSATGSTVPVDMCKYTITQDDGGEEFDVRFHHVAPCEKWDLPYTKDDAIAEIDADRPPVKKKAVVSFHGATCSLGSAEGLVELLPNVFTAHSQRLARGLTMPSSSIIVWNNSSK